MDVFYFYIFIAIGDFDHFELSNHKEGKCQNLTVLTIKVSFLCQESFKPFYSFFQLEIHNNLAEYFLVKAFFLITSTFETLYFLKSCLYFDKLVFTPVF